MEKIKELLKNKKIVAGTIAGLAVVVILIIVIAVSCGKNDDEKNTEKSRENTTAAKVEKNTADEETTEPESETEEDESVTNETTEGSTEAATEENTTEQLTTIAEEPTTIYAEPKTEAPTEAPTQPQTEAPVVVQPQPVKEELQTTEKVTEAPTTVKHYADNGREMSELEWNILNDYWMEDVSYQYSKVCFFESDEYGKGIEWLPSKNYSDEGGSWHAFEIDGDYKIIEVFNGTSIIDFDTSVTIIYADGSFKEFLKPSSSISSKYNEWMNDASLNSVCKYGLDY